MKNYYWRFRFESKELDGRTVVDSSCVIASTAKKAREAAEYRIIDMGYVLNVTREIPTYYANLITLVCIVSHHFVHIYFPFSIDIVYCLWYTIFKNFCCEVLYGKYKISEY